MPTVYRKILRYAAAFIAVVTLTFIIPRLMPGDPVINLLGEDSTLSREQVEEIREELGLNKPLILQYGRYWKNIITADFGYSYHYNRKVLELISGRVGWTLLLILPSVIIGGVFGSFLGSRWGWRSEKKLSKAGSAIFLIFYSTPPFFLAMILLYLFSFKLGWFPLKGYYDSGSFRDILLHIILPVSVLSLFSLARNSMIIRGSVIQEKGNLYVLYARAKGLRSRAILIRHVFWNASLPLITIIALDFGFMFSGALFVEMVFSMNGMGTLLYDAVKSLDYPVLQGAFLIISWMIICANAAADLLYSFIDPRLRVHR